MKTDLLFSSRDGKSITLHQLSDEQLIQEENYYYKKFKQACKITSSKLNTRGYNNLLENEILVFNIYSFLKEEKEKRNLIKRRR